MYIERTFMGIDGLAHVDRGETSAAQILSIESTSLYQDNGEYVMSSDPFVMACVRQLGDWVVGPRVLEIGYGMGYAHERMLALGLTPEVCDSDSTVFTLAQTHYPNRLGSGTRRLGDFEVALRDLPNGRYDTIVADVAKGRGSLMPAAGLALCRRLLRTDGYFIPHFPIVFPTQGRIPDLPGFVKDDVKRIVVDTGDPDYRAKIRQILRRRGQLDQLETLVAQERQYRTRVAWLARFKKV